MEDSIHLERMGSELKCPICLSLVISAVSLPCNHVFCHCCIEKSMKSCSNCPVCKLPYRRREVRPVPHMDNLVSIYKSMEAASGFNIFVTQNAVLADLTDAEMVKSDGNNAQKNLRGISSYKAKKKQNFGKKLQRPSKSVVENNDSTTVKPSFPNKKRVQVPLTILSETPIQLAKNRNKMANIISEEPKKSSNSLEEKLVVKEKEGVNLLPFFWLRDEDVEMSSQHTDSDQLSNGEVTMPNLPSFSDIQDSDDENCLRVTPTEAQSVSNNVADQLDSEMFEWTQRPCSPELCTCPLMKMQVESINGKEQNDSSNFVCGEENETLSKINSRKNGTKSLSRNSRTISSLETNTSIYTRGNKSRMKQMKERQEALSKSADIIETSSGRSNRSKRMAKKSEQIHACPIINHSLAIATRTKRNKKIQSCIGDIAVKSTVESALAISLEAESVDGDENIATDCSASLDMKDHEDLSSKKKKSYNRLVRYKKQKVEPSKNTMVGVLSVNQNTIAQPLLSFCSMAGKAGKLVGESVSNEALARKRKVKPYINNSTDDQLVDSVSNVYVNAHRKPGGRIEGNLVARDVNNSGTVQKLSSLSNEIVSQKCDSTKVLCAFCHSSEETETTGEIVHYSHGQPIASDGCISDAKIIHSHQSCAEWAPNVYFENDIAINLEAEVKRSRRIKCSCCGIRGASLGCYDKSCRKSFHVPCARLIPQCRWDADNFVMLCPLHPDTKFPYDSFGSEHKKESTPKGYLDTKCDSILTKHTIEDSKNWNDYGSSKKLVLCCSSLTIAEMETVSVFERISRVTVLKKWDTSVTHVIASTAENGSCKRTIKVLMAILQGKWVLNVAWIKSCLEVMKHVDETSYEITADIHGFKDGPRVGRLRAINKQPKLFAGLEFFFIGDFVPSYKGCLQELAIAGGGTILQRKPKNCNSYGSPNTQTFIIYSVELPDKFDPSKGDAILNNRRLEAEAAASSTAAKVATNSWLLNSIAAGKLQSLR